MKREDGVTLIELLIYAVIFGITAVFLVNILTAVTRIQLRQTSVNEVNQELSFVGTTIQRLVRQSSVIENAAGVASTTLILRMSSSTNDPTRIYVDASSTGIFLTEGSSTVPLTSDKVIVSNFSVTKYENPGGFAVVQVDLTLSSNATNPLAQATRTWRGAISRISAATFDSDIIPNSNNSYNFGSATNNWKNGYFSGVVGVGTTPSQMSGVAITSGGNIGFTNSSYGLILKSSGGTCYLLTVLNGGNTTTTQTSCP